MKLATYKDGSRDGQLVVVSRDLSTAHYATGAAHTLRQALDDWNFIAPQLQDISLEINRGRARQAFAFDPAMCMAPLPRSHQCVRAAAYASHRDTLLSAGQSLDTACPTPTSAQSTKTTKTTKTTKGGRKESGQARVSVGHMLADLCTLAGDAMQGATDPFVLPDESWGLDFESSLAAITADIPAGSAPARALEGVRLLMLANTWCLREWQVHERASGLSALQSRPGQAFSPVAVTPDELGDAWAQGRVALPLQTHWNGRRVGLCDAAPDMTLHLGQLLAQVAATRALRAGTVVTTGPLSCPGVGEGATRQWPQGFHSIVEKRAMEVLQQGQASTGYLRWGDTVRVELKGRDGQSLMGTLAQQVQEPVQP